MKYNLERKIVESTEIEVKPCPFCNSNDLDIVFSPGNWGYSKSYSYVKCNHCNAMKKFESESFNEYNMKQLAIEEWNKRRPLTDIANVKDFIDNQPTVSLEDIIRKTLEVLRETDGDTAYDVIINLDTSYIIKNGNFNSNNGGN